MPLEVRDYRASLFTLNRQENTICILKPSLLPTTKALTVAKGSANKPSTYSAEKIRVADDDQAVFGTCQCDVEAARVIEEAEAAGFVGADAGEDDVVFFTALECVHTGDLHS